MSKQKTKSKNMLSDETIYKIMQWLPVAVSAVFFLKNVSSGNTMAMITIGVCLFAFISIFIFVKVREVSLYVREYIMAIALPILVFMISLFSGESYSDDFPMFLAVIALTGLFLEPKFTKTQFVLVDIFLVLMYLIHPQKAGSLSQYILCAVVFTLAASLFYQVIKRGRAFIEISEERAKESEQLLESIRRMGATLQHDFGDSSAKIESGTQGLQKGSNQISNASLEVSESCDVVRGKVKETEAQIGQLNKEVRQFEDSLAENKNNVEVMDQQVNAVSEIISESGQVFRTMEGQMKEIAGIAKQISDISFKLTILSLNASVEAARAGDSGSGFEVIASEMRELSESSGGFSNQVSDVVKELSERVEKTSERFSSSEDALLQSKKSMSELVSSFGRLSEQFSVLYENIECQNENVNQIDSIFTKFNYSVSQMHESSMENQNAVDAIVEAMADYKENIAKIVENTQSI